MGVFSERPREGRALVGREETCLLFFLSGEKERKKERENAEAGSAGDGARGAGSVAGSGSRRRHRAAAGETFWLSFSVRMDEKSALPPGARPRRGSCGRPLSRVAPAAAAGPRRLCGLFVCSASRRTARAGSPNVAGRWHGCFCGGGRG